MRRGELHLTPFNRRLHSLHRLAGRYAESWRTDEFGYVRNVEMEPICRAENKEIADFICEMHEYFLPVLNKLLLLEQRKEDLK